MNEKGGKVMTNEFKTLRKKYRYTMKEMSEILNISISYYQKVEYGIRKAGRGLLLTLKTKFPEIDLNQIIKQ